MLTILIEDNRHLLGKKEKETSGGSNLISSTEVDEIICREKKWMLD
jgi:hypothetical protein